MRQKVHFGTLVPMTDVPVSELLGAYRNEVKVEVLSDSLSTAVRIIHLPTGKAVTVSQYPSVRENATAAVKDLLRRINPLNESQQITLRQMQATWD